MTAKISDIEWAVEFASAGFGDHEAYIDKQSGAIFYVGDAVEEDIPDELFDNSRYIAVPDKRDLGLGKRLAIRFISEHLPTKLDKTYDIFSRSGAYGRFKELLTSANKLDDWYSYEELALKKAIIEWCNEYSVKFSSDT